MKVTRRLFLGNILKGTAALAALTALPAMKMGVWGRRRAKAAQAAAPSDYDWSRHAWAFVVDTIKCIGCGKCVEACKIENNVPMEPEFNRTWVERYVITGDDEIYVDSPEAGIHGFDSEAANAKYQNVDIQESFFVPKLCNQCDNPPCVQVCPVNATYRTEDGVILVDAQRCIGCGYCVQACPYGARYLVPRGGNTPLGYAGVADKCTWCYHRITKGLRPACVEVCPVGARLFGDTRDPQSPIVEILKRERVQVLKPSLGTRPKVYYIGLQEGVR